MIVSAAVKVFVYPLNKEIVIKCHRHCDAYEILSEFGYKWSDYDKLEEGFLDEDDNFYNRIEAWKHAYLHNQINPDATEHTIQELFSEDLY